MGGSSTLPHSTAFLPHLVDAQNSHGEHERSAGNSKLVVGRIYNFPISTDAADNQHKSHIVSRSGKSYWRRNDENKLDFYGLLDCEAFDSSDPYTRLFSIERILAVTNICKNEKDRNLAIQIHGLVCYNGLESQIDVGNGLVPMFIECGNITRAQQAFLKLSLANEKSWTALMAGFIKNNQSSHAFDIYEKMEDSCTHPSSYTFVTLLNACAELKAVDKGRRVHMHIVKESFENDIFVGNALVDMYCKLGFMVESQDAFDMLPNRDIVSWNSLISGYVGHGLSKEALVCFKQMHGSPENSSCCPDEVTLACALKACGILKDSLNGRNIHTEIVLKGHSGDPLLYTSLISMYACCGLLLEAREVVESLPVRDVVSWTALLSGYADHGFSEEALDCAQRMEMDGVSPNIVTFCCLLKACGDNACIDLTKGHLIHMKILQTGYEKNLLVGNTLVGLYAKHGAFQEAENIFHGLVDRNVVSWNALITGYGDHGSGFQALECFQKMKLQKVSPDLMTYASIVKSCGTSGALGNGQEIHAEITKKGLGGHSLSVENSLITMYANCGLIAEAQYVFNNLEVTDVISWTAIMKGYAVNHKGEMAVACFEEMQEQGIVQADDITLTCLLTACSHACLVMDGIQYLKIMREKYGIIVKEQHYSCIIDLLGRSGNLYEAERTLEALCPSSGASWAALLSACKAYGDVELGLRCFRELSILEPDNAAWYVLMKDVYANANRQDDALTVEMLRVQTRTVRKPARASIEVNNVLHEFCASEIRTEALSSMMQSLNSKLKHEGHLANVEAILKPVNDEEKEVAVCEHAERIAIAFGLLHTPQGHTLHVTKNLRMCNDCHTAGKTISRVTRREIILRDESCVHHFKDGLCLCNDMF